MCPCTFWQYSIGPCAKEMDATQKARTIDDIATFYTRQTPQKLRKQQASICAVVGVYSFLSVCTYICIYIYVHTDIYIQV